MENSNYTLDIVHPNLVPMTNHDATNPIIAMKIVNNEKFNGIIFRYGSVEFVPQDSEEIPVKLQWSYDLLQIPKEFDGIEFTKESLEAQLFEYLLDIIDDSIKNKKVVYHGGTE